MTSNRDQNEQRRPGGKPSDTAEKNKPEWADGLRRLYDSVVDEPIPDSFTDLLSKLDKKD